LKAILIVAGIFVAMWGLGYAGLWFFVEGLARGDGVSQDGKAMAISSAAMGLCGVGLVVLAERLL
jgi:hypothetical protein